MKYWVNISKNIYHMTCFENLSDARAAAVKWMKANKDLDYRAIYTAEYGRVPYGEVFRANRFGIPQYTWKVHDTSPEILYPIAGNGDIIKPGIKLGKGKKYGV